MGKFKKEPTEKSYSAVKPKTTNLTFKKRCLKTNRLVLIGHVLLQNALAKKSFRFFLCRLCIYPMKEIIFDGRSLLQVLKNLFNILKRIYKPANKMIEERKKSEYDSVGERKDL